VTATDLKLAMNILNSLSYTR